MVEFILMYSFKILFYYSKENRKLLFLTLFIKEEISNSYCKEEIKRNEVKLSLNGTIKTNIYRLVRDVLSVL